ncbi:S8 family serine peptidase [Pontibacter anaerobius]|uniref:S8 family serine peptidase n=1 Tax=Pontibacter anaerobius TaxID=2993940 RepID=A0ABT3RC95_9BACT|nr:S8 family serine peptidase [Pontibacter anaerobius]MCX2739141.1 S8 family serine peptidase [Pontibacter anaerobius]
MNRKFTLRRSIALTALAAAVSLTGCQKDELMENQFAEPQAAFSSQNGQAIEGQYIVVFKNGNLSASNNQGLKVSKVEAAKMRERVMSASNVDSREISQVYEGVVNGFAARLSQEQVSEIRKNPEVAYVEQDRIIALAPSWKTTANGNGKGSGDGSTETNGGKGNGKNKTTEPAPTEPAPSDSTTTEPVPTEPTPADTTTTEPAPTTPAPAYTTITPLAGETLPWNIERVGFGDGTGKTVWVIDSGIDTDHADLNVDVARSFSFIYGNPSIEDGFGHGTSVSGVIAAKNNGSGMIGVAANATIIALRVFDDAGAGTVSRAISAVNHVSNNGKPGDVVNMSLGSGISSTLDNAVQNAAAKGILFAIAAGNSAVDCSGTSPARVNATGVYTISAMDSYSRLWSSSNFGAGVDFAAPGVNVTATSKNGSFGSGHYGTSLAAPHVAGILALRGEVLSQGFVTEDKDSTPDPIASVK